MSKPMQKLESDLRDLIEADRASFVEMFEKRIRKNLESFLERRKPNKFLFDVYGDYTTFPIALREATDYYEAQTKFHQTYRRGLDYRPHNVSTYPAWEVNFKPEADQVIHKIAERQAEEQIQVFLGRALSKLLPISERRPKYDVTKTPGGGLRGGTWCGWLRFDFEDGPKFNALLKIITNFSKHGKPFGQYPMTFHHVTLPGKELQNGASIEEIWESVGYKLPAEDPSAPRKKWSKIIGGSVILMDDKPVLITSPGQIKKLGVPADAPQIARIEAGSTGAYIEHADGRTEGFKWTEEDKDKFYQKERASYIKASADRKREAFKRFFPAAQ